MARRTHAGNVCPTPTSLALGLFFFHVPEHHAVSPSKDDWGVLEQGLGVEVFRHVTYSELEQCRCRICLPRRYEVHIRLNTGRGGLNDLELGF